jgi:hypothetical protein
MIAAGINAKALSSFMGHASITVTFDLYGHLMSGSEAEGIALLDAYLDGRSKDAEEPTNRVATDVGKRSLKKRARHLAGLEERGKRH